MAAGDGLFEWLGMASLLTIIALATALVWKMQRLKDARTTINTLKRSLDEMDEQAKLIVRTDMELNKTQEELDKKITGLYALQRLSRTISTTLEEKQIFKKIDAGHLEDIGFEKAIIYLWDKQEKKFASHLDNGYTIEQSKIMDAFVNNTQHFFISLINNERTATSNSLDEPLNENLKKAFAARSFVISPVIPKEGEKGFFFVGTQNPDTVITDGDEELITILANQLGSGIENARLFEKTWQAQQDLETRVEQRTRELSLALEEVKKINRRKTDFVSSVSHELRMPLTSIKGYASILLTGKLGELPEEARRRTEKINQHSDELVQMVNDLLDISRLESGRATMDRQNNSLKMISAEAADLLSVHLKEQQIEFSVDVSAEADSVSVDKQQMTRVFINLIGNALKFTPPGGKISVLARKLENAVQVDVTDTGCGIPPDAQQSIFEEFYRVDNQINQQVKGTGLGLALVKHIVEAHQGKIWVTSAPGAGSTFSFTLTGS